MVDLLAIARSSKERANTREKITMNFVASNLVRRSHDSLPQNPRSPLLLLTLGHGVYNGFNVHGVWRDDERRQR